MTTQNNLLKIIIKEMLTTIKLYNASMTLGNKDSAYIHLGQYAILKDVLTAAGYQIDTKSKWVNNHTLFKEMTMSYKTEQDKNDLAALNFDIAANASNASYKFISATVTQ